jgi:hypothetical protein
MESFEVDVRGERWRMAGRRPTADAPAYDLTWLSGPGAGTRGLTVAGAELTREQLIREATAYMDELS